MRPVSTPGFLADIVASVAGRNTLVAGSTVLFAAGLDPRVWGPALPSVQAAIRERPDIEAIVLLASVGGAALLLLGGVIGDTARARPILLFALSMELVAAVAWIPFPDGPLFLAGRIAGAAGAAFAIPVALASVAMSYTGIARATAIGIAYAAYGLAGAIGPILLQVVPGSRLPGFVAAIAACVLALVVTRRRIPDLPRPTTAERPYVVATAIWGLGIVSLTAGVVWFGGGLDNPLRWALVLGGGAIIMVGIAYERRRRTRPRPDVHIERRPVAVAVVVGVVIAFAQVAPMLQLPLFFGLVLGYGPLFGVVALLPLFVALVAAGPVAGFLLSRAAPRVLVSAGVLAVGAGDLALAALAVPGAGYPWFVIPCFLVGAGFVVATTVRTAIIFASVPRGLPATAAALNEASISVGTRVGTTVVTAVVAETAIRAYEASVAGQAGQASSIEAFRNVLAAVGTPAFHQIAGAIARSDIAPYADAYTAGIRVSLLFGGLVSIVGGAFAWVALGPGDPLVTVYEHRDERTAVGEA